MSLKYYPVITSFFTFCLVLFCFNLIVCSQILNPGSVDRTFADSGLRNVNFHDNFQIKDLVIQSDGKILLTGNSIINNQVFSFVYRLDKGGNLDPTFNENGWWMASVQIMLKSETIALQSDGKILVGGFSFTNNSYNFSITRLGSNGHIDSDFGNQGTIHIDFSRSISENLTDELRQILLYEDGRILLLGLSSLSQGNPDGGTRFFSLARLTSAGSIDTTFGSNGKVVDNASLNAYDINTSIIQRSGKIVVGGAFAGSTNNYPVILRYLADGTRDQNFGNEGKIIVSTFSYSAFQSHLTLQPNDKFIFSGFKAANFKDSVALYSENGILDQSFGNNGIISPNFTTMGFTTIYKTRWQNDGRLLVLGSYFINSQGINDGGFAISRFFQNGEIDTTFGFNGTVLKSFGSNSIGNLLDIFPDGRIIVGGNGGNSSSYNSVILRYLYRRPRARGKF